MGDVEVSAGTVIGLAVVIIAYSGVVDRPSAGEVPT